MFKKLASLLLVVSLVCTLCAAPAFARTPSLHDNKPDELNVPPASGGAKEAETGKSLRAEITKLVADARAGRRLAVPDPQNQSRHGNSLSKRTKIVIVAGIGAVIILAIMYYHFRRHLFDNFSLGNR